MTPELEGVVRITRKAAAAVDAERRFPHEAMEALTTGGFLQLMVPIELGGGGGRHTDMVDVAWALGGACLSTALCWVMHSQQVLTLMAYDTARSRRCLQDLAHTPCLVASVTSEPTGGDLLTVRQPVVGEGAQRKIHRVAPMVSYVNQAGILLVTMRASESARPNEVVLVIVPAETATIDVQRRWDAMGMRGTCSHGVVISASLPAEAVLQGNFRDAALGAMIPAGHVGWSAAWLGAAESILDRSVGWMRETRHPRLNSDHTFARLADCKARLLANTALLRATAEELDADAAKGGPSSAMQQRINALKFLASEDSRWVVDVLIDVLGIREGYRLDGDLGLNRVFRDLRSASLMFPNHTLRQINGRLLLRDALERST